jgi:endonuclease IV
MTMPPQNENLLDSIRMISDGLSAINYRLADMLPTEPGYDELEHQRNEVYNRFIFLVRKFYKDSTNRYIEAESRLAKANNEMTKTLERLENMQETFDKIRRFVTAIDGFISDIFPTG